jgi:hypothetical protein
LEESSIRNSAKKRRRRRAAPKYRNGYQKSSREA